MPWVSQKQEAWGNSPAGHKALGDAGVEEWNAATEGKKLPVRKKESTEKEQEHLYGGS